MTKALSKRMITKDMQRIAPSNESIPRHHEGMNTIAAPQNIRTQMNLIFSKSILANS